MQTQIRNPRHLLTLAVFVAAGVAIMLVAWHTFGGRLPLEPAGYRVEIPMRNAVALTEGSDVTIAGVHVGDVVAIRRATPSPLVEIQLDPKVVPLRVGTRAMARTKSLLGEGYVQLVPGPRNAATVPDGSLLPARDVEPSQTFDDVIGTFAPAVRRDFSRMFAGLGRALRGRGDDLNATLADAGPAANSFAALTSTLDAQRDQVAALVRDSGAVFTAAATREGHLQAAIDASNDFLGTTATRASAIERTVAELPRTLSSATVAGREIRAVTGDLDAAVRSLEPSAPRIAQVLRQLERVAPEFRATFRAIPPVTASSARGLPALDGVVGAARPALAATYPAMRELIPTLQLTSAVRRSIVAFFANIASLMNGRLAVPGQQSLGGVLSAMPSFWNETIGGWKKKLPSSRPNPYPKPDSSLDVARGGLKAFDCRHTSNRAYVPPTGSGSPPCVEQGAWTFNGKTAYYPRLRIAPP